MTSPLAKVPYTDSNDVRPVIRAAWQRARELGLAPERVMATFDPEVDRTGGLVRAAAPVLDELAPDLAATRVAVILADARGQVLDRRVGDPALLEELDRMRLAPGYLHAEDAVGTNSIGTALVARSAIAVAGAEHFADALTTLSGAGAPITDPRSGRIVGVVALTALACDASALMLPLAVRLALEVQQRLVDDGDASERLVLQRFLRERRRAKGPVVLLTQRRMVTNASADHLVQPGDEALLRRFVVAVSAAGSGDAGTVRLRSGTSVSVRLMPIDEPMCGGVVLRLTPLGDLGGRVSSTAGQKATFGWESLTSTERSVTALVAQSLTNREVAERLFLSPHTVGFHLRSVYRKLDVSSRVHLARLVFESEQDRQRGLPVALARAS